MASSSYSPDERDEESCTLRVTRQRMTKTRGTARTLSGSVDPNDLISPTERGPPSCPTSPDPDLKVPLRNRDPSPQPGQSPARFVGAGHSGCITGSWRLHHKQKPPTRIPKNKRRVRDKRRSLGISSHSHNPPRRNTTTTSSTASTDSAVEDGGVGDLAAGGPTGLARGAVGGAAAGSGGTLRRSEPEGESAIGDFDRIDADNPQTPADFRSPGHHNFNYLRGGWLGSSSQHRAGGASGTSDPEADLEDNQDSQESSRNSPATGMFAVAMDTAGKLQDVDLLHRLLADERQEKTDLKRRLGSRNRLISRLEKEVIDLRSKLDIQLKLD